MPRKKSQVQEVQADVVLPAPPEPRPLPQPMKPYEHPAEALVDKTFGRPPKAPRPVKVGHWEHAISHWTNDEGDVRDATSMPGDTWRPITKQERDALVEAARAEMMAVRHVEPELSPLERLAAVAGVSQEEFQQLLRDAARS